MLSDFTFIGIIYAAEPSDGNVGAEPSGGNTFSTDKYDIAECEHRSRNRVIIADSSDFPDNPLLCTYCANNALDGTELKWAVVCENCGAAICENCNEHNSDSDKDSGIGEE